MSVCQKVEAMLQESLFKLNLVSCKRNYRKEKNHDYLLLLFVYYMHKVFLTDHRFMGEDQRTQGGDGRTPLLGESGL